MAPPDRIPLCAGGHGRPCRARTGVERSTKYEVRSGAFHGGRRSARKRGIANGDSEQKAEQDLACNNEQQRRLNGRSPLDLRGHFTEEGSTPSFRAYVYVDNDADNVEDLVAHRMDVSDALSPGAGGYNTIGNKFLTVLGCNLP